MALSFSIQSDEEISFDDFINTVTNKIKKKDEASLLSCSDVLLKLANNKQFFLDFLNTNLMGDVNKFQLHNQYSEQSYILHETPEYFVRLTYWPILSSNKSIRDAQNKLFSYGFAHDHNFSLLTAGYKGKGYKTDLWEYDYDKVIGYAGESVDLRFLESTYLSEKKALYFRPSKDIHCQFPPEEEDALAINIILRSDDKRERQYAFDTEAKRIKSLIYEGGNNIGKFSILNLAQFIHNDRTVDLLEQLSNNHEDGLIRQESLDALYKITSSEEVWKEALRKNTDPRVRAYARMGLEMNLGGD